MAFENHNLQLDNASNNAFGNSGNPELNLVSLLGPSSSPADRPFSAAQIENSGLYTAGLLSSLPPKCTDQTVLEIHNTDNPAQLAQDIDGYRHPGAAGGLQQWALNDCWFQATLASYANTSDGAEKISEMIKSNPDGSYTVTFPGEKNNPITVSQADVDNNPNISNSAEWGNVLEAAIYQRFPKESINGANPSKALQLLTGEAANVQVTAGKNASEFAATIQTALDAGKPVVAGSNANVPDPLIESHVYGVVKIDPATNRITLRNPYGDNEVPPGTNKNDVAIEGAGDISMSMDTFMKNYCQIASV